MRFYIRWPAEPADCDRWSQQPDTADSAWADGVVDRYVMAVAPRSGESAPDRFRRVADRLMSYDVFPTDLMRPTVCAADGRLKVGTVIVQRVRLGFVVIEAAVRVVETAATETADTEEAGFSYLTLAGHPERGVSSFWVIRHGDDVVFRIEARSRPGTVMTRIGRPISRLFQRRATRAALRHVALEPSR
jgi:uncharacterized protein (UPF0548 family)